MKLHKFKDRKDVQHNLYIYEERLAELRDKYGWINGRKAHPLYAIESRNLKRGIRRYKRLIMEIDKRQNQIVGIANMLCIFLGKNVKNSAQDMSVDMKIARGMYYKYCLEEGICGSVISEYVGAHPNTAAKGRMAFTKSFIAHPERKELYYRWKEYIESYIEMYKEEKNEGEIF